MEKKIAKPISIAQFNRLSIAGKRIAIARNVIAALEAKKYLANQSSYIEDMKINGHWARSDNSDLAYRDIQATLVNMNNCEVCALGACILSITKYKNKLKFYDVARTTSKFSKDADNVIKDIFTPEQFAMIEIMFEGYYTGVHCNWENLEGYTGGDNYGRDRLGAIISEKEAIKCMKFYSRYKNPKNRMIAIMTHIINNKGEINL